MSEPLTPATLDELERLLAATTEGSWSINALRVVRGNVLVCTLPLNYRGPAPADAAAIVALHNAAPTLIAAAREVFDLRARLEAAERERDAAHDYTAKASPERLRQLGRGVR